MQIIIEGIDKAGKTTLINDIREALSPINPVVIKLTQKPSTDKFFPREFVPTLYKELHGQASREANKDHVFLFDRSFPSEMIYSIKRGYDAMDDGEFELLDRKLGAEKKTLLIYCEVDPNVLKERFQSDKEDYVKGEEIQMLLDRYEYFLSKTTIPFVRINSLTERGVNLAIVRKFLKQQGEIFMGEDPEETKDPIERELIAEETPGNLEPDPVEPTPDSHEESELPLKEEVNLSQDAEEVPQTVQEVQDSLTNNSPNEDEHIGEGETEDQGGQTDSDLREARRRRKALREHRRVS